jgi:hypothetical protein
MLKMKKKSSKGRPRKDEITKLKVMAWFRAVAEASGKTSAQLEREFADPNHIRRSKDKNQEIRPGLWDKYRRGEVEPRARPINESRVSVVQAVEAKYPGTAKVLTLPLWKLMDFRQPATLEELNALEQAIQPAQNLNERENVLATESPQARQENVAEPLSPSTQLNITIDQWIRRVISVRKATLAQQEVIMDLLRINLEASNLCKHKERHVSIAPKNPQPRQKRSDEIKTRKVILKVRDTFLSK